MTLTSPIHNTPRRYGRGHLRLCERLATIIRQRLQLEWDCCVVGITSGQNGDGTGDGTPSQYVRDRLQIEKQLTDVARLRRGIRFCHACHATSSSAKDAPVWMSCTHRLCRDCTAAPTDAFSDVYRSRLSTMLAHCHTD